MKPSYPSQTSLMLPNWFELLRNKAALLCYMQFKHLYIYIDILHIKSFTLGENTETN